METGRELLVATRNAHKTSEIRAMLGERFSVRDLNDLPEAPEIAETGTTFRENAALKAVGISEVFPGLVLADDSGLEVDALDGAPGVYSARYAGPGADDAANNTKVLKALAEVPDAERTGRFRCAMVVAQGGKVRSHFSGAVEGRLLTALSGEKGFGYDPLFVPDGYTESFAVLGSAVKNEISHRSRALSQVVEWLEGEAS